MFRQDYTCPVLLFVPRLTQFHEMHPFAYGAITRYGRPFQTVQLECKSLLGCSPFARRYLGNLG